MNKGLRNRWLAAAAAGASSILLLSGFDSAMTAEDVTEKMRESMISMGGVDVSVRADADISIDISSGGQTQSVPVKGTMDYTVQLQEEPLMMAVSGSMSGDASAMGIAGDVNIDMYLVQQDDGTGIAYVRFPQGDDTGWHAAAVTEEDMNMMTSTVKASLSSDASSAGQALGLDLGDIQEKLSTSMSLAPDPVNVNGVDCYEITQTVDGAVLLDILSQTAAAMPQAGVDSSTLSSFGALFDGIVIDGVTDCSVDSFAPVYAGIDLSGSDFSAIGQMFGSMMAAPDDGSQTPDVSVTVNTLKADMQYSEPSEIVIPQEALAAEIETTMSLSAAANEAQSTE